MEIDLYGYGFGRPKIAALKQQLPALFVDYKGDKERGERRSLSFVPPITNVLL